MRKSSKRPTSTQHWAIELVTDPSEPTPMITKIETTAADWADALAAAETPAYPDGKTLAELAIELGVNRHTLRYRLDRAIKAGTCKVREDRRKGRATKVYIIAERKKA